MKIGAHVSGAGGLQNAPLNAQKLNLETFQFFSRSPQGGPVKPITKEVEKEFKLACETSGFDEYYIHTPYILNLASDKTSTRQGTIEIIKLDLVRANQLGATAIMTHLGSANKIGNRETGVELVAEGIKKISKNYNGSAQLLLEISAGAGMTIGSNFEEMAEILKSVGDERIGICFDTAHAFASGYDLRDKKSVAETLNTFNKTIGLNKLKLCHVNDSKVELGTNRDRHEHIGQGFIGKKGFEALLNHPSFKNVNLILETPHDDELINDINTLKKIRDKIFN